MSLTINTIVGGTCGGCSVVGAIFPSSSEPQPTRFSRLHHPVLPHPQLPSLSSRNSHISSASDKFSSRTGKFDSKNRRNSSAAITATTTTRKRRKEQDDPPQRKQIEGDDSEAIDMESDAFVDDEFVMPDLPGLNKDFWEGPQWDALGFFVQYMWAFGIGFALIACGIAVTTYNEGAADFKDTAAYKESVQSRDLFEVPDVPDSDVFDSNPTEEAPSLE